MAAYYRVAIIVAGSLLSAGDHVRASWAATYDRATQLFNRAEFQEARAEAQTGSRTWCPQRQIEACERFRLLEAESLIELDRIQDAFPLLNEAARSPDDEARRLADLALAQLRNKHDDLAEQSLAAAQRLVPQSARDIVGRIELTRGMLLQKTDDRMAEAEVSLSEALAAVQGSNSLIESYALSDLGFLDLQRYRFDEALNWLTRASDLARRNRMQRALVVALGNLGAAYMNLGDFDRASKKLNDAAALAEALHDRVYQMPLLVLLGETWYRSGDLSKAAAYYEQARLLGNPETDKEWLSNVLDDMSQIALRRGDLASARELNAEGIALSEKVGKRDIILNHRIQAAAIAAAGHEYAKAERVYADGLTASRGLQDPVAEFRCHAGLASLYRDEGSVYKAEHEYGSAAAVIDDERARLWQEESKFSFAANLIDFYHDYVDFLFDRGDAAAAFHVAESSRARVLAEKLHRQDDRSAAADLKSLEQEARSSGVILFSYWLAPKRSLLWVIDAAGLHSFTLPPAPEIEAQVRRYSDSIQRGDNPIENRNETGQWLFANLFGAHYHVTKGSNVVIEPDGVLHQLNFESLPDENGDHYWIEEAAVSVAPSLALLRQSPLVQTRRLLVFGDPGYDGTEFQPLPHAGAELQAVESHFADKNVFVSSRATPAAYLASHPETYSTLHFAAHAVANRESPLDSAIVLAGSPETRKLYAREILQQPLTAELVTLSACQTAGSRTYYGEGLTGFSWAFLSAGAHNVVAGLWDIDDRATASLMRSFYGELASGQSPVSALRRAKLGLLTSGGAYRKPRYWAALEVFTRTLYQ